MKRSNQIMKQIFEEKIKDSLLSSTVHALPNIARTQYKCIKAMWAFCLILSTSAAVFFTSKSIIEYLEFEAATTYNTVYEDESVFPSVSICSHGFNESLEKTIKSCLFHGNYGCNVNKSAFFEEFEDIANGKCWRFNGRKSKKYL